MKKSASYPKRSILLSQVIRMAKKLGCYPMVQVYCEDPKFSNYSKALGLLDKSLFEYHCPSISTEGWKINQYATDSALAVYVFDTDSFVSQVNNQAFIETIDLMVLLTLTAYRNIIPRKFGNISIENQHELFQNFFIDMRKFFLRRYYKQSSHIEIHLSVSKAFGFFLSNHYHQFAKKADLSLNLMGPGSDKEIQDLLPDESKGFYESPEISFQEVSDLLQDPMFKSIHLQFISLHYGLTINEDRKVEGRSEIEPMTVRAIGPELGLSVDQVEYVATQVLNLFFLSRVNDKLDPQVFKTLFKKNSGEVRHIQLTKLRISMDPSRKSQSKKPVPA
jgi:hypothetical protein